MRSLHNKLVCIALLVIFLITLLVLFGGDIVGTNQRRLPDGGILYTMEGHEYVKYYTGKRRDIIIRNHYEGCPSHNKGNKHDFRRAKSQD